VLRRKKKKTHHHELQENNDGDRGVQYRESLDVLYSAEQLQLPQQISLHLLNNRIHKS
jgi:hypothetical protein